MPIRGAEHAVDRVVAVLQANLPAEFNLMDALWNDGIVLDDVPDGDYHKVRMPVALVAGQRAILVYCTGTDPIRIDTTLNSPGRYVADHLVTVEFQIKDDRNEQPHVMQSRAFRSAIAIERVLAIKNPSLPNGGVETVTSVKRRERAEYDVQAAEGDESGEFTRICRIPFAVHVDESL